MLEDVFRFVDELARVPLPLILSPPLLGKLRVLSADGSEAITRATSVAASYESVLLWPISPIAAVAPALAAPEWPTLRGVAIAGGRAAALSTLRSGVG